jgi:FeS assembly SUF system regulator
MFRVNKLTDYGIVLMAHVARAPEHSLHSASGLAEETHLPLPTVSKLLRQLSDHHLLASHRGVKGGYTLPRDASAISLAEIILALEGPIGFTECGTEPGSCEMEPSCAIKANSQMIGDVLREALEKVTLNDLNQRLMQTGVAQIHSVIVPSISLGPQGA